MKKNSWLIMLLISVVCLFNPGCSGDGRTNDNDCFEGLSNDEKTLVKKIIVEMTSEKGDSLGVVDYNTPAYYYYTFFGAIRTEKPEPISDEYAALLKRNYDRKRARLEPLLTGEMRGVNMGGRIVTRDASSVWMGAEEFAPFLGQLLKYQFDNDTKVGMKIVFGAYPYDAQRDGEVATNGQRQNLDSLSGRNTVYFVGTYDTTKNKDDYFVTRHKEIKDLSLPVPVIRKGPPHSNFNHGTLCPDSCTVEP